MDILSGVEVHFGILNAFCLSYLLIYFLKDRARQIGFVDVPDLRKRHDVAVPVVGGIAVFVAFSLSTITTNSLYGSSRISLLAGGAILMLEGALDDRFGLTAPPRFLAQIAAAGVMMAVSGVMVHSLGNLTFADHAVALGNWSVPFTIFATVGVINAFNMSDGIDGLLGSLSIIALLALGIVAGLGGQFGILELILVLIAAVSAFLLFNLRTPWRTRAAVFMGDAGSTFLGFAITWFVIDLSQGSAQAMPPVIALWILMVPLYDTVFVMCGRVARGRSPLAADRHHLHHLLLQMGNSVNHTLTIISAIAVVGASFGLIGMWLGLSDSLLFLLFLAGFIVYSCVIALLWLRVSMSQSGGNIREFERRGSTDEHWAINPLVSIQYDSDTRSVHGVQKSPEDGVEAQTVNGHDVVHESYLGHVTADYFSHGQEINHPGEHREEK